MGKSILYSEKERLYAHKELSWLSFNDRVLQEATDKSVPIIQRVRYLGIFSSNLDEFFRVRVGDVRRLVTFSSGALKEDYSALFEMIMSRVSESQKSFNKAYKNIIKELQRRQIYLIINPAT